MAYTKYSLTPANNTAAPPDGAPEGMLPSAVNDTMRDMMAQIRDCGDGIRDGTYTMTAPKITGGTITGSTINNSAIGATTASTGAFTSLTDSGNLTFTGTGNRITGDFSTVTLTNRPSFQSSVTNGATVIQALPNGTGVASAYDAYNNSDPTNAGVARLIVTSADVSLRSQISGTGTYIPLTMFTGGSERLRIDTSGNVGIGMTNQTKKLETTGTLATRGSSTNTTWTGAGELAIKNGSGNAYMSFHGDTGTRLSYMQTSVTATELNAETGYLAFSTNAERMRIDSSGNLLVGTTSADGKLAVHSTSTSAVVGYFSSNTASYTGSHIQTITQTASGTGFNHLICYSNTGGTTNLKIIGNGNVQNANNSYGAISDIKLKENIVDASPKLAKLMDVKIRNYNLKGDYEQHKQLGVIAQELETVFPSLVEETADKDIEGNELGTTTKSVKYSVFVPMLIKAIQELNTDLANTKLLLTEVSNKVDAQAAEIALLKSK